MAVEVAVSLVIQKLSVLLREEIQIFEKVRDEIEKVMVELSMMQCIFNNSEYNEQSNTVLTDRALRFLGMVYRVEDVIESYLLVETRLKRMGFVKKHVSIIANKYKLCRKVPDQMGFSQNVGRLKSDMKRFSIEIQEWKNGIPSVAVAVAVAPLQPQPWEASDAYYVPMGENTIFKNDAYKLLKQITSDSKPLEIICVFGDIGIGKAAYVKKIYSKPEVKSRFACHALLVVDTKWSFRHLILTILRQMTRMKGVEKLRDEVLIGRLHGILKGKKYLIVINDIKRLDFLEKLRGALPDAFNGSRVVITTSDEQAASFADATSRYHFKPVDMEDGLNIFINKVWGVKGSPFSDEIMEDLKNRIDESCKGTPLRISLLAGLLSTRREIYEDWLSVFAIRSPSFDILAFCYNDLPLHLKPCFLYLGLFPKGFEIPVRRLFRLWLAEGFVKPSEEGIILEDLLEGCLEELVNRNMVEITKRRSDESPKKCKMTGSLHDIFRPRAVEIGLFHLHVMATYNSNAAVEHRLGVRRVVECTNIKYYPTTKVFNQYLQSYISLNNQKKDKLADGVGTFLGRIIGARGFGLLKVLDLEGVDRPRLPENLGNLFHLRYLGLRCTFLNTLPSSLGALLHLETLDIKHTQITTLPSSIWSMKHLRHLCLNGAPLDIPVQSMNNTSPSQLQTLQGLFVDEKIAKNIGSTLSRMTNLRKLDLTRQLSSTIITTRTTTTTTTSTTISRHPSTTTTTTTEISHPSTTTTTTTEISHPSSYEKIDLWISSLSNLQSLRLRSKDTMGRPSELVIKPFSSLTSLSQLYLLGHLPKPLDWYEIPCGLKVLTLSVSRLDKDPMPTLSKLPSLIALRLLADSYVGEEMCCPENGFPALRILKLWNLEKLKILTAHRGTMQNLHTLEIRFCRELEKLPVTLLRIQTFDNLILTNMPKSFASAVRKRKEKHTKIVEKDRIYEK